MFEFEFQEWNYYIVQLLLLNNGIIKRLSMLIIYIASVLWLSLSSGDSIKKGKIKSKDEFSFGWAQIRISNFELRRTNVSPNRTYLMYIEICILNPVEAMLMRWDVKPNHLIYVIYCCHRPISLLSISISSIQHFSYYNWILFNSFKINHIHFDYCLSKAKLPLKWIRDRTYDQSHSHDHDN